VQGQSLPANLLIVVSIAQVRRPAGVHLLDAIEKGNEGLMRAVDSFAGSGATNFAAYAAESIERAISIATG